MVEKNKEEEFLVSHGVSYTKLLELLFMIYSKGPYLVSNLFSDKASHKSMYLYKIPFLNDILFLSYVKLKL